jgi:hypothetical protein
MDHDLMATKREVFDLPLYPPGDVEVIDLDEVRK